ncbi:MAG TPA: DUF6285 domain-containing protein [Castellaniella sp.]|uniref:DUF6285 domain-containing protein n=1 Tax=Castellaniella sp. TaxID=1955812 RepID=UPI002F018390
MINQPDGAALLHEARRTLMEQLLPALPPNQAYTARMVARAMGIAARELQYKDHTAAALSDFLDAYGFDDLPVNERSLCSLIRERKLTDESRPSLVALLMLLTRSKLELSNPKYLQS